MWNLADETVEGSFATGDTVSSVYIGPDGAVLAASGRRLQLYKRDQETRMGMLPDVFSARMHT